MNSLNLAPECTVILLVIEIKGRKLPQVVTYMSNTTNKCSKEYSKMLFSMKFPVSDNHGFEVAMPFKTRVICI